MNKVILIGRLTRDVGMQQAFHLSISGMKSIFNFFIIVGKNFL